MFLTRTLCLMAAALRLHFLVFLALSSLHSSQSMALPLSIETQAQLMPKLIGYSHEKTFLENLKSVNHRHRSIVDDRLDKLEAQWQTESKLDVQTLYSQILESPISEYLKTISEQSEGLYPDIVVFDKKGLVIGMTLNVEHYVGQHDDRFHTTWSLGPNGVYVSEPTFSVFADKPLTYICLTIEDYALNRQGVIAFGVDTSKLN